MILYGAAVHDLNPGHPEILGKLYSDLMALRGFFEVTVWRNPSISEQNGQFQRSKIYLKMATMKKYDCQYYSLDIWEEVAYQMGTVFYTPSQIYTHFVLNLEQYEIPK